ATARRFSELGCPAIVCDPRDLRYDGRHLSAGGRIIDLVQRRVLFPDFLRRADELAPLLRAVRDGHACMVNPLRSYVAGNKSLLAFLNSPRGRKQETPEDLAVLDSLLPATSLVTDLDRARLAAEQPRWVLKSAFGYGGNEVVIGDQVSQEDWRRALDQTRGQVWIAQERIPIPRYRLPLPDGEGVNFEEFYLNWSP